MRDYALAVAIHLNGGDPRDFSFVRGTVFYGSTFPNPYSFSEIGFQSKAAREAAHKKAKEWLDKQKK
jgi:hypothetical protein